MLLLLSILSFSLSIVLFKIVFMSISMFRKTRFDQHGLLGWQATKTTHFISSPSDSRWSQPFHVPRARALDLPPTKRGAEEIRETRIHRSFTRETITRRLFHGLSGVGCA